MKAFPFLCLALIACERIDETSRERHPNREISRKELVCAKFCEDKTWSIEFDSEGWRTVCTCGDYTQMRVF